MLKIKTGGLENHLETDTLVDGNQTDKERKHIFGVLQRDDKGFYITNKT